MLPPSYPFVDVTVRNHACDPDRVVVHAQVVQLDLQADTVSNWKGDQTVVVGQSGYVHVPMNVNTSAPRTLPTVFEVANALPPPPAESGCT